MENNNKSFRITDSNKPATPGKWFLYMIIDVVLLGGLFFYTYSQPWGSRMEAGVIEILFFVGGGLALVFIILFLVDSIRWMSGK